LREACFLREHLQPVPLGEICCISDIIKILIIFFIVLADIFSDGPRDAGRTARARDGTVVPGGT